MTEHNERLMSDQGEDLADLFRRASRMMARHAHRSSQAPHAQQRVLSLVRQRGPITQGELLELLDVRSSSLSEILRKLENNGFIVRRRNEADKRGFILSMHKDAPMDPQIFAEPRRHTTQPLFSCLTQEEQQQLRTLLVKMITCSGQEGLEENGVGDGYHRRKGGGGHGPGSATGRHRNPGDQPLQGWGRRRR